MDAAFRNLSLSSLIFITGCAGLSPAPRPADPPKANSEPPQIVKKDTAKAADGELEPVQKWLDQMKGHGSAQPRSKPASLPVFAGDESPATGAADIGPAQPATNAKPQPAALTGNSESTPAEPTESEPAGAPNIRSIEVHAVGGPETGGARRDGTTANRAAAATANAALTANRDADLTLQEIVQRWLSEPGDGSFREQLDRRVLNVLNNELAAARKPLDAVSAEQQRIATNFIETLITLREAHGGDPSGEAARVLPHLEQMRDSLTPLADLSAPVFVLCKAVRGFGQYDALASTTLTAGRPDEFVAYLQVSNFASRKGTDDLYESQFSLRTQVISKAGDVVLDLRDDSIMDRCRTRRNDCFIPRLIQLPGTLSPGDYVVKATIADKIGQKVAEVRTPFKLAIRT